MAYVVTARWVAKEGEEDEVARCVAALVGPSRAEPGNLMYQPHRSPDDPRVFFFYEQYEDEAAFQAHLDSPHVREHLIGDALPRLESRERAVYTTVH